METFGERLKSLREEKGLSLRKLAEITGLSRSSLSRWECSQSDILASQLSVLADFFGVTVGYLLGKED